MSVDDSRIVEKYARRIIASELRSYDSLSRPARIKYEHSLSNGDPTPLDVGVYQCAHGVWLYQVCSKCQRSADEALGYAQAMKSRLAELLAILEGGKS